MSWFGFVRAEADGNATRAGEPMTAWLTACSPDFTCRPVAEPFEIEATFGSFSQNVTLSPSFIETYGTGAVFFEVRACPSRRSLRTGEPCDEATADFIAGQQLLVTEQRAPASDLELSGPPALPQDGVVPVTLVATSLLGAAVPGAVIEVLWQLDDNQEGAALPLLPLPSVRARVAESAILKTLFRSSLPSIGRATILVCRGHARHDRRSWQREL